MITEVDRNRLLAKGNLEGPVAVGKDKVGESGFYIANDAGGKTSYTPVLPLPHI